MEWKRMENIQSNKNNDAKEIYILLEWLWLVAWTQQKKKNKKKKENNNKNENKYRIEFERRVRREPNNEITSHKHP